MRKNLMGKSLMKKAVGFSLIELMIAVAIVGIIAAIALPSYQASVRKSNRAEAKTELTDAAQRLQRCYTLYASFNNASCGVYGTVSAASGYITRGGQYYKITIGVPNAGDPPATTYRLTATAVKAPQTQDTDCARLTLSHTGARAAFNSSNVDTTNKCW
jgi:type IV pilus assembly protein PilE